MILLSVHLITFNNEQHIEETLQSILKQKVDFDYEIVVGDDCSTDSTLNVIETYAAKHPNIFNIKKNSEQLGILKNFKATLDRCSGTFVFDIAGDDMLKTTDALQKMVNVLKSNHILGFVDSGFDSYYEDTKTISVFKNESIICAMKEAYKEAVLLGNVAPIGQCFRKDAVLKHVDFDTYINMNITIEDYPILVDMVMNTEFERINEPLCVYRSHDASYSHEKDLDKFVFQKLQMKKLFNYFAKKYTFPIEIRKSYLSSHNKALLFYAGYFSNKKLGKEVYKSIKSKSLKDRIHYLASQYPTIRKLVSLRKSLKIN
ncbi:glycosyltransferase family 2 protein [Flavobacteriaceae bacterium S0825]|uniref:glycosyltransferase family 2 protein n=1 Tax=Gaetbulibacter sp. S0825 TaxID=2720084 RepID=UPI0014313720|nr:glycosyltransferase family 2 protein [Gaetbulibacter sp. S0825]MCK0110283.1 glycosyltransferase family 2 protein [Flavobacteriaceae bacterium S0825]NIX65912.1 glycosyltransferase family 2 protein [Gaetbulibacter sp. S0825]